MFSHKACASIFMICIGAASGNAFLKIDPQAQNERMSEVEIQTSLLGELEGGLQTTAGSRVSELEIQLRPIFNALPKTEHGGLSHNTVRYALHRIFVQRHGWFIKGLDRAGDAWNGTSPAGVLKNQVPAYVQDQFEKRLSGKGLGLHELAVLAATIEHLVHSEALSRLGAAFNVHELPLTSTLSKEEAKDVLETYMIGYILGDAPEFKDAVKMKSLKVNMAEIYHTWPETQEFIGQVLDAVSAGADRLEFGVVSRVAEKIGEQFGSFQDKECHQLKATLLKSEHRGTGRVRLADFYKPNVEQADGAWHFQESVSYLKQVGALDTSSPGDSKVIITNYIGSQANCIASSSFYAVCCMDQCESLLGHLESEIKVSEATPARIGELVSRLPSDTVESPRELSKSLLQRLDQIAETHGGSVPLHGRLFAQWMHHAYPRECPYPHVLGTTAPLSALDWMDANSDNATASMADMERIVDDAKAKQASAVEESDEDEADLMPWSHEEELLVVRAPPRSAPASSMVLSGVRAVAAFAAVSSAALALVRTFKSAVTSFEETSDKFYV